jgi:hypothetical protein
VRTSPLLSTVLAVGAGVLLLSACSGPTPTSATYSTQQTAVFHEFLPYAVAAMVNTKVPYGGRIEPDQLAGADEWRRLELQGQQLCDNARAHGWPDAKASLTATLADATRAGIDPAIYVTAMVASVVTQASYCPELAAGALPPISAPAEIS